jgi:apolipoprotein N-acyltransferase
MAGYGGLGTWGGTLVLVLLSAFLALYQAIFGYLVAKMRAFSCKGTKLLILASLFWVGLDWLKNYIFTGFNWTPLAAPLGAAPRLLGLADILGVYGLGFFIALINFSLAELIISLWTRKPAPLEAQKAALGPFARALKFARANSSPLALLVFSFTLICAYGAISYSIYAKKESALSTKEIAVLQASVEQEYKWDSLFRDEILGRYTRLAKIAANKRPFLIVWPETAAPFAYGTDYHETLWLNNLLAEIKLPMLVGLTYEDESPTGYKLHNRAWLLYPDGTRGPYYDKKHLVPFGEFVPLIDSLPFLRSAFLQGVLGAAGNFSPGEDYPPIEYQSITFGPAICFESIFPYLIREQAAGGAQVILVTTNDAWFGTSYAPDQHFNLAVGRAVEVRKPILRAANNGLSGLILASGKVFARSRLNELSVFFYPVPIGEKTLTLFVRGGYLFAPLCGIFTVLSFFFLWFKRNGKEPLTELNTSAKKQKRSAPARKGKKEPKKR